MNRYTKPASILAMLALALPAICQAQDTATANAEITAMKNEVQISSELKKSDQSIKLCSCGKSRPDAQSGNDAPPPLEPARITVKADASIIWGDVLITGAAYSSDAKPNSPEYKEQCKLAELIVYLKDFKEMAALAGEEPIVLLSASTEAPHQRIVDIMSALATAGIKTVAINATPAEE